MKFCPVLPRLNIVLALLLTVSCALPPREIDTAGFVPSKDLQGVGLAREALAYLQQSNFIDAELKLRQALYLFPDADNLKENLALAVAGNGIIDEAEYILNMLAKRYPKASRHFANLGEIYYQQHRYDDARAKLGMALVLALSRGDVAAAASVLRSLSVVEFRVGNEDAAVCHSVEAFQLKHDAAEALRHARLLLSVGRYAEVTTALAQFSDATAERRDINRLLALSAYAQGQFENAKSILQRVLDENSEQFEGRDEIELLEFLIERRIAGKLQDEVSESDREKIALLNQEPTSYRQLYWPPQVLADFYSTFQLAKE